jgi:mitogen-activated protein kinase organizer 1
LHHLLIDIQELDEAKDSVSSICMTENEIIAGSIDGNVRTYDIRKGALTTDCVGQPITSVKVSHDSNCLLISCLDDTIRLLDKSNGELLNEYKGHKNTNYKIDSALSRDDAFIFSGSEDGLLYIWDLVEARVVHKLKGHTKEVCALDVHPHEPIVVSGSVDGTIRVWK